MSRQKPPKLSWVLFALAAAGLVAYQMTQRSGPSTGTMAADFDLPIASGSGERVRLSELRGTVVVVEAFAGWCRACREVAPTLDEAARAQRQAPVRFIGVSIDDSAEQAAAVARSWGISYDVAWDDGGFADRYDISHLPTVVVVDQEGKVAHSTSGSLSRAQLEAWLTDLGAARRN